MNISSKSTNPYLELRKGKFNYLLIAFILLIVILVEVLDKRRRDDMVSIVYSSFSWSDFWLVLSLISIITFLIFNLSDNRIKLKISDEGIWTKKYNIVLWKDIWYVSTSEAGGSYGKALSLKIKLRSSVNGETEKELNVGMSNLDYDLNKFWEVLGFYCTKYGVQNLGHSWINKINNN